MIKKRKKKGAMRESERKKTNEGKGESEGSIKVLFFPKKDY
jgi:hypothetical protein